MCLQIHRCRIYFSIAFQRPSSDVYLAVLCHTHTRVVPGKHVHEACPPSVLVLLHSALCASSRTVMLDVVFQLYVMSSTSRSWECLFLQVHAFIPISLAVPSEKMLRVHSSCDATASSRKEGETWRRQLWPTPLCLPPRPWCSEEEVEVRKEKTRRSYLLERPCKFHA